MQKNVLEYLEYTAEQFPEKVAFADEGTAFTFFQLYRLGRSAGTALIQKIGSYNRPVAVLTDRTAASVLAFLGVLFSGNYYVPIDRRMPKQRMERLLRRLQPAALVFADGDLALAESFAPLCPAISISEAQQVEPDDTLLAHYRKKILDVDPVYVIFTSGSTGDPKGIVISHRSIIDFTDWFTDAMNITSADVLGNQAPFFFDLSVKDLYTTLKTGATTYILPKKCFLFPVLLMQKLDRQKITTLSWATSAFHLVANSGVLEKYAPSFLKQVILGGEALQARQLNIWRRALPEVRYVNLYGPTEVTVDCTWYPIDRPFADTEVIPIGKACANMEVFLLDTDGKPVPRGQPGEICVRGAGVALGYYGDWEKTERAFVQDPRNPWYPAWIYRTGDLAVEDADGNFCFLSRKDNQVKHAGYRVELGEIETALNSLPQLRAAVCLFDPERDKIVCVYEGDATSGEIATAIWEMLPKYMLPNIYRRVDQMPYNVNGKIDRIRLKQEYDATNHKL